MSCNFKKDGGSEELFIEVEITVLRKRRLHKKRTLSCTPCRFGAHRKTVSYPFSTGPTTRKVCALATTPAHNAL